jgi:hypothetical protein
MIIPIRRGRGHEGSFQKTTNYEKKPSHAQDAQGRGGWGVLVPHVSSLSVPLFPFPHCLWLSSSSTLQHPFPSHEQWLMAVVGWCCWYWSSSLSSRWSLSSCRYGHRGPVAILVAPCFQLHGQLLAAAVGVLSQWWSPSYQWCCYGGGVCCPACPSSVVIIVWWSCHPPLHSSPFCPTSVARGRGGWFCVAWAWLQSRPSVAGMIIPITLWSGWSWWQWWS